MNTKSFCKNNGIVGTIQHGRSSQSDMRIGLTGKTSLAQDSNIADRFCSTIGSSCTAERSETCSDIDTVISHCNNSVVKSEEFHHYVEPDDGMNAQHTTNPVEPLNRERHEVPSHNNIPHDGFGTNGILFAGYHSSYLKSRDCFSEETSQGADCCDRESFENDSDDDTPRYRFDDEIADGFEQDAELSVADRFRSFLQAAYDIIIAPSYRIPKKVKKIRVYPDNCFFGVCPRCNKSIDREYQDFCNCCGQRLDWSMLDEAEEEHISNPDKNSNN